MENDPLKSGVELLRNSRRTIQDNYDPIAARTIHFAGISVAINIFLALFKIGSGVLAHSVFTCINGLYTAGMVLARGCAVAGMIRTRKISDQYRYYRWSGVVLVLASCFYIAYAVQMYLHPVYTAYHPYVAMGIATVTFTEIGLNLRGVLMFRKSRTPLLHAIKTINLATSLISLVLTQAAILSFADETQDPSANGIMGAVAGTCALLLGVYMLLRVKRITDQNNVSEGKNRRKQ